MDASMVRSSVKQFTQRTGSTGREEHAFAPWYLNTFHSLPIELSFAHSSDGNYDYGLDAFHLEHKDGKHALTLIQAKFTENLAQIAKGYRDLERSLETVHLCLIGQETEVSMQNKVLWNLRARLNELTQDQRTALELDLVLLHLSSDDPDVFALKVHGAKEKLVEAIPVSLPERIVRMREVGPADLGPKKTVVIPPSRSSIELKAATALTVTDGQMFVGVGKLGDLVSLYELRRDDLFARNVRYYLRSKKNTEKGPAAKMRQTLKEMCIDGKGDPRRFALFHNGVTVFVKGAELGGDRLTMREPYVLNGCQTIKNAFFFKNDPKLKSKIKNELWNEVAVPVRVIETRDEELVRTITVNNNRQNAMSSAALRSNDPVQISLEQRFRARGIFYQRQEGAFENIWAGSSEKLDSEYSNTGKTYVDLHDLARALAAVSGDVRMADRPNDLFESDAAYSRCFEERKLESVAFLTLLQNLSDVLGVLLKKDLGLEAKSGGPPPSRFAYQTMCLLVRYLAKNKKRDFVINWGDRLYGKDAAFREQVRLELGPARSGIKTALSQICMKLESSDSGDITKAFEACEKHLNLKSTIDPFAVFADVDSEVEAHAEDWEDLEPTFEESTG